MKSVQRNITLALMLGLTAILGSTALYAEKPLPDSNENIAFEDIPEPLPAKVEALEGEAWLIDKRGTETPLVEGMEVKREQGIRTGSNAYVALLLGDDSRIVLPAQSSVVLLSEKKVMQVKLLQGQVESYVSKREPQVEHFQILTPVGVLGVRGTHFRARQVEGEDTVLTEVLSGSVAAEREERYEVPSMINAKQGMRIVPDGDLNAVDLLPGPQLLGQQGSAAAQKGWTILIKPLPGAKRYRVQVASDPRFMRIKREQFSNSTEVSFFGLDLPLYYVRISAFDELGLEGLTSIYHVMHFLPVATQY
ncbi:FecR family protein [Pseudomonas sp.]|uniref:FecR family protein n=1 Tax=Pseudomonas sp. TaxID=306 RepID=UPI003A97BC71